MSSNRPLTSPLVLIAPSAPQALTAELEGVGARVLNWPQLNIRAPDSFAPLDEAIENLFGYDWLIFQNAHAVDFFFRQFKTLGREISEIDSLRVCAAGAVAVSHLDASQVHIDVVPDSHSSRAIFDAIETYVGGRDSLRGLNFLIPGSDASRDYLREALEEAGARADLVKTYCTCSKNDPEFTRLSALLVGGGIDCIAFTSPFEVHELAQLFDTNELGKLLNDAAVACIDERTALSAVSFDLTANIAPTTDEAPALAQAIASYFMR